jgi:hypothetical protein
MTATKRVYLFGNGKAEGKADMKNLLGGKGANLAEMNLIGVPVPPALRLPPKPAPNTTASARTNCVNCSPLK